ncbi:hypothetical protein HPB47_024487 [Ixodes persulcatus]|uniref:Uncharacterized protein n=1 Tax=Ixodes persulcatus TaxID=34615 RepID=A0AC60Q4A9_IXOPE|nr:hypothetical protein HPB47_024487 [Ixodes persulcatus]
MVTILVREMSHFSLTPPFLADDYELNGSRSRTVEGSLSMFICAHSAMLASDHLGELCRYQFRDSEGAKHLQLHRSKCSALIKNVVSPHFVDELLSDLAYGSYSLILDESTDISVTKLLGVVIVYYSEKAAKVPRSKLIWPVGEFGQTASAGVEAASADKITGTECYSRTGVSGGDF